MITSEVISEIYKKYNKRPASVNELDLPLLFEKVGIDHDILVDPETNELTIGSIEENSPFRSIPLRNVNAIIPFENWTAIVMHSSIIFLHNKRPQVSVHLKENKSSIFDKIFGKK